MEALPQRLPHASSSTARKNAGGIEPSSTSSRNSTPEPRAAGSIAQPDRGEERIGRLAEQLDRLARADRPLDADRRRLAEADVDAVVARQRRLDDLLLHLAVERDGELLPAVVLAHVDQRVLLGELGERDAERALVRGRAGTTTVSSVGGAKWCSTLVARRADRVADPDLREAPELPDLARGHRRRAERPRRRSKTLIAVTFRSPSSPNRSRSRVRTVPENMRT